MAAPVDVRFRHRSRAVTTQVPAGVKTLTVRTLSWVVLATLIALIVVLPIPYGAVQAWWISLFEVVVFIATILWIIEGLFTGSWFVREHQVLIPLALIVLFALAQTVPLASHSISGVSITRTISADPFETKQFVKDLVAHILVLGMLIRFTDSKSRLRTLTYVVIGTGVGIAVFGLLRLVLQPQQGGFLLHYLKGETGFGPFINRNHFSFLMEMTMGLIAGLAIFGGLNKWKLRLAFGFGLTIWLATSLSNSRGGIFALVCQIMLGFLIAITVNPTRVAAGPFAKFRRLASNSFGLRVTTLVAILIVVIVGTVWIGGDKLSSTVSMVPTEIGGDPELDTVRRADIWKANWRLFEKNPLMGCGFGAVTVAVTKYHEKSGIYSPHQAHNDYLEILASGGLIAAALTVWFVFGFCRFVAARVRSDSGFVLAVRWGAVIALFGVAIHSFVEFGLHVPGNSVVLMVLLAMPIVSVPRKLTEGPARSASLS